MFVVRPSILRSLAESFAIPDAVLEEKFPALNNHPQLAEIAINEENKQWLISQFARYNNLQKNILDDENNLTRLEFFFVEYLALLQEMDEAEESIQTLKNTPFRQSRNAFGFASGIFGAVNFVVTNVVIASASIAFPLLIVFPLAMDIYLYRRGVREENIEMTCMQENFVKRKANLLKKHKQTVQLRMQNPARVLERRHEPDPPSEFRNPAENPVGHFIISFAGTAGMLYTFLKFSLVLAGIAVSGPVGWALGVALGIGFCVGLYFGLKRRKNLLNKVNAQKKVNMLAALEGDLTSTLIDQAQNSLQQSSSLIQERLASNPVGVVPANMPMVQEEKKRESSVSLSRMPSGYLDCSSDDPLAYQQPRRRR